MHSNIPDLSVFSQLTHHSFSLLAQWQVSFPPLGSTVGVLYCSTKPLCIFIGCKDSIKGYKLWNPVTKKIVYSGDVVSREIKYVYKQEVLPSEKNQRQYILN
jgi:hypothetical protein